MHLRQGTKPKTQYLMKTKDLKLLFYLVRGEGNGQKQIVIGRALCRAPLVGMPLGQLVWGFPELQLRDMGVRKIWE